MKTSKRTKHGVLAILELAQNYNMGPLQLRVIAQRQNISIKYLEQLMALMRSSALVCSVQGVRGGYLLARAPEEIRLSDVFHCLEETVIMSECIDYSGIFEQVVNRIAVQLQDQVEEAIDKVLGVVTLRDVVEQAMQRDIDF